MHQMNGPRCTVASAGPWVLRLCEENVWHTSVQRQNRYGTWPLRLDPAVMLKLSAAQRGVSSCSHLTLRRDLAEQGRVSDPVASCSSPRVGRRTFVRISACLPVIGRTAIPAGREASASQPLQVQRPQMLRPIIMTVKFAVCEVPALVHANQREVPA